MPYLFKAMKRIKHPIWKKRMYAFKGVLKKLTKLGGMSFGNKVHIYTNQEDILRNMINAIKKARFRILIETYIFDPDPVGIRIRDALIEAASRGVEVIFIYDHFGSSKINNKFLAAFLAAEIRIFKFNPIQLRSRSGPLLFRNHRKIATIDDTVSFCGSMNISSNSGRPFRETVLKIQGPAVWNLLDIFVDSLYETTKKILLCYNVRYQMYFLDGIIIQVLGSNQNRKITSIQKSIRLSLKHAKYTCYLTTPYFLPFGSLKKAILDAAERGIDIRILISGKSSDVRLMRLASCHIYGQFLKAGVRIYEFQSQQQTLHAKTAAIDGVYAWVGSFNLDRWSYERNLEVNVGVIDRCVARRIERHFKSDLKNSKEIFLAEWNKRNLLMRIVHLLSYQVMKL